MEKIDKIMLRTYYLLSSIPLLWSGLFAMSILGYVIAFGELPKYGVASDLSGLGLACIELTATLLSIFLAGTLSLWPVITLYVIIIKRSVPRFAVMSILLLIVGFLSMTVMSHCFKQQLLWFQD